MNREERIMDLFFKTNAGRGRGLRMISQDEWEKVRSFYESKFESFQKLLNTAGRKIDIHYYSNQDAVKYIVLTHYFVTKLENPAFEKYIKIRELGNSEEMGFALSFLYGFDLLAGRV